MYKNKSITCVSLLIILLILFPACSYYSEKEEQPTLSPDLTDRSWLNGEPCRAPCWYGLEPGKSHREEIITKVKELSFINPESMIEKDTRFWDSSVPEGIPGKDVCFDCKEPSKFSCVFMRIKVDTLYGLYLYPNYEITFQQAVKEIGDPDYFMYQHENPEGKGCYVWLLWVEQRMEIVHSEGIRHIWEKDLCDRIEEADNKIPMNLLVYHVLYMDKRMTENAIEEDNFIPWNGFISK